MKTTIMLLLTIISLRSAAQGISGRVFDEKKQPLINAGVQVFSSGGIQVGGIVTDYDGNYIVKPLEAGFYTVLVRYAGYDSNIVSKVVVHPGAITTVNINMTRPAGTRLKEVVIKEYRTPVVSMDNPGSHTTTREQIAKVPTQDVSDLAALSPGTYQSQRSNDVNIGNARTSGTQYIIDGVMVQGTVGINGNMAQAGTQFYNPSLPEYKKNPENDFRNVKVSPVSTMSVDVDRASYSNIRRFITQGQRPPVDAVRVEEMINYFEYDYPQPTGDDPIAIQTELTDCPWQEGHKLLHIGIQARKVKTENLPPSNLVFLIDVSGSMGSAERLPLLVSGMKLLVLSLRETDKVSIVTYAGNAGLALPPTNGEHKQEILDVLDKLTAGGSTAGGAGIKLAYKIARQNFVKGGNNRVLLATDGDFNVGVSSDNELEELITKERESGVYLTCLGFGTDNYKDAKMEMLADKGNGNYDYIDNLMEAQKILVSEFGGTLFTIAKDVKAQIEFNPEKTQGYRLIGYENRMLNTEDFKDDKKDAGDMGAGHTVTIIYELIPAGITSKTMRGADDLKYQKPVRVDDAYSGELASIKFRYKKPDGNKSTEMEYAVADSTIEWDNATENTRFSEAVAMFGMLLRDSKFKGTSSYDDVISMAEDCKSADMNGYRAEFLRLVKGAKEIQHSLSSK